ncbi:flagellin [Aquabacter sp. CN5-332]|uniref:flagellin N-terminal helical domain-containing protein n=1 Tax=Aquabacter sp. CN5-332 TaxID=3156608 RepID=UPI0032B5BE8C
MTSLITNTSAMVALQTLRGINNGLDSTNTRVSTGLRINSAQDGAAYWSIATTTRSDNGALGAAKDALALGKSSVDVAKTGMDEALDALKQVKNLLVTASSPDADRSKIQQEIKIQLDRIAGASNSASTSGNNWLSVDSAATGYNAVKSVVGSFSRSSTGVTIDTIDIDTSGVKLYDTNAATTAAVQTAATTGAATYATAVTTYDTAVTTAGTTYTTAVAAAQAVFDASPQAAADQTTLDTAIATATTTRNTALTTAKTTLTTAQTTLTTALDTAGSDDLGIMDQTRVAFGEDGSAVVSTIAGIDISALTGSADDLQKISNYMSIVDDALGDMTDANTTLGANAARIASQSNFAQALIDANDRAIGALVDADMEAESTKLKALQTQQQLAIQSLSIANSSTQNVLSLFRS